MIGSVNPFVGPRPLTQGEALYGRDDEVRDLDNLLAAERILVLHSPSGAGKSSLLQAGLLPRFKGLYDIWGPTRVNQELDGLSDAEDVNRYALSAMLGFEEGVPEKYRRSPEEMSRQSLSEYAENRPRRRSAPDNLLLIFDQFEEILTVDPLAVAAKRAFFDQLGDLLQNPGIWALFALREDYLAPLDPYAQQVTTHLRNRFRIDLLGLQAAREAMVKAAQQGGRAFPAAERLVHDLAIRKVQQPDGSFVEQVGHHVEPVQLQVVCRRLWEAMPADDLSIDDEDLDRFGNVNVALSAYYADAVARISGGKEAVARAIRDWFNDRLLTPSGIRMQVLRGAETSGGLDNALIAKLLDTHLVRAEQRAGATWYELAHDRLVEIVQVDNERWREEHLSEFQIRAEVWEHHGRPPSMLLTADEIPEADAWAENTAVVNEVEHDYLAASYRAVKAEALERRQAERIQRGARVLGVMFVVALGLLLVAGWGWRLAGKAKAAAVLAQENAVQAQEIAEQERAKAEEARELADANALAAKQNEAEARKQAAIAETERLEAQSEKEKADAATRLAEENALKAEENARTAEKNAREAEAAKRKADEQRQAALAAQKVAEEERQRAESLRLVARAEALAVLTTSITDESRRETAALLAVEVLRQVRRHGGGDTVKPEVYNALRLAHQRLASGSILLSHRAAVRSLAVAADGTTLASGDDDGEVHLLDLDQPRAATRIVRRFGPGVRALAFSPRGRFLAAGTFDGAVVLLDLDDGRGSGRTLRATGGTVHALTFLADGQRLASGDADGTVQLWDLEQAGSEILVSPTASRQVRELAAGQQGALAAAIQGKGILLWNATHFGDPPRIFDQTADVRSVSLDADERFLVAGTGGGGVLLWRLDEPQAEPIRLQGHRSRVVDVHFHPRRRGILASASLDGTLRLWDVQHPDAQPLVLLGHDKWVWTAEFTPDGKQLISGSGDRTVHVWVTDVDTLAEKICEALPRNLTHKEWDEYLAPDFPYESTCPDLPDGGKTRQTAPTEQRP